MNILYKTALGLLLATGALFTGSAQTALPSRVEAYQPQVLLQKLIYESEINDLIKRGDWGQSVAPREKKHWVAVSDRVDNVTYASPSTSAAKFGKLDFNEQVVIAKIQNGFALVYTDPKYPAWPGYSEKAQTRGWIPMNNLLLWQSCPADTKGIYQKALLAANLEKSANRDLGFSYKNPDTKAAKRGIITDMTFYFVMKTDPKTGLKLLANQSRLDGRSDKVLYGWVDSNSFVPWNQRSCLEPNWRPTDVAYFNSPAGKQYPIYPDAAMKEEPATFYQYGIANPGDTKRSTQYRMNAHMTRFPILDQKEGMSSNVYKCTTFGSAGRAVINGDPNTDPDVKRKAKIEDLTRKLQHINIIFCIDGTQSMKPYFAATKDAIRRSLDYFDSKKFTPRVGAVIYRDYDDGEYLTEAIPLSKPNDPKLLSFLDNAGVYGAKSSANDRTNTEALFKGLEVATDAAKMGFNKDESTLLVVIGDCGNEEGDSRAMSAADLGERLYKNNIQMLSFQVLRRPDLAWNLFNRQMCSLVKDNLTRQYRDMYKDVKTKFNPLKTGYDFSNGTKMDFYIGTIRFAEQEGQALNPASLTKLIEDNVGSFAGAIQSQIDILIAAESGNIDDLIGFEQGADNKDLVNLQEGFLKKRLGNELFEQLKKSGATVTFTGYAPKKDNQNRDYWKAVAFMSAEELETLMGRLANLYNNSRADGDRKPYVDAVKALIRVMVPDITERQMDDMGIAEVMRLANGLNEGSDAVKGRSLTDIQDARVVNAAEYQALVNGFREKYENLRDNVKGNKNYKYSYTSANGLKYYWIPVEDLP